MATHSKKKILYVTNDAGTFVSHRMPVARGALNAGFDVHVAAPASESAAQIAREGFAFHAIPLSRSGKNVVRELNAVYELFKLYRMLRPDLIEHSKIKPVLYGSTVARLLRVPGVVNWVTGLGYVFIARGFTKSALRFCVENAYRFALGYSKTQVIFENPDDRDLFIQKKLVSRRMANLIRGAGVSKVEFYPRPEHQGPPLVVLPARLLWDKGVGEFVAAARSVKARGVAIRFALVGDVDPGNPATVSRSQLEEWQKEGIIECWGFRSDMFDVLTAAHIVCLPSYREGLPRVLVEAAACGRAVVTTDVPGCREVVQDGTNGYLVPVRNSEALADAIFRLAMDSDMRQKMGVQSRAIMEEFFSDEIVVKATLSLYQGLLS